MGALSEADFQFVAREVRARSGAALSPDKAQMLEMRLTPIGRREGFTSVQEMITTARARQEDRLLWAMADALTIGETCFFRDRTPFIALRDAILPELAHARGGQRLRILSAACASGQEPYSIAMLIEEARASGRGFACEIVAVDVSERMLERARAGMYSQFEVQRGLPISMLVRHFEKIGEYWRIADRARAAVKFQRANLVGDMSALGRFDAILCRNVLGGFDAEMRGRALAQLSALLAPDGYLILGAAEGAAAPDFAAAPGQIGIFTHAARTRAAA